MCIIDILSPGDRVGIVLFHETAHVAKPLDFISNINDLIALKDNIRNIVELGGTNMEAGMKTAAKLYDNIKSDDNYENRIIFLTDAIPTRVSLSPKFTI